MGSMGSHDPLEAMEITLELHLRPLGAAGATSWRCTPPVRQNGSERRSKAARQEEEEAARGASFFFKNRLGKTASFWPRKFF